MKRSIPLVLLALLLLTMGVVAGRFTSSAERSHGPIDSPSLPSVSHADPVPPAPVPVLAVREDRGAHDRDLAELRSALEVMRAERDRLAVELAKLQEQAKRWEALADLERAQRSAHEMAAIATSRNTISALAQMQVSVKVDEDRDGTGEYAGFLEMSGAVVGRIADGKPLVPPVMASAFRTLSNWPFADFTRRKSRVRTGWLPLSQRAAIA